MAQMEIPGVLVGIILDPLAKILKIKYIPKDNRLKIKKIFEKIASKAKKLDTGTFQKIIAHLEDIISPASSVLQMFAVMIRPLISVIPPQYLIIVVAVLLLAFVMYFFIYPVAFLGLFMAYKAEEWVKVPFVNLSKRSVNAIYPLTWRDQFIVKKTEKKTITATLLRFLELPLETQYDYLYENEIPTAYKLILDIFRFFPENLRTVETLQSLVENPPLNLPSWFNLQAIVDALTTKITLTATYYSGMRRVFPPLLHRVVNMFKSFLTKTQDNDYMANLRREVQEHPLQAIFGFVIPMYRAAGATANPEKWKPEPNV